MDIAGNAAFRHLRNDSIAAIAVDMGNTGQIKMVISLAVSLTMGKPLHTKRKKLRIIDPVDLTTAVHQSVEALELPESNGCHNIRHVALIAGVNHIVFPRTRQ